MDQSISRRVLITDSDLARCSFTTAARFHDPAEEAARVEVSRRFLAAAFAAEQAVRAHSRCALVNHCGTHGTTNLVEATEALFEALYSYAASVREIAARFRDVDMLAGDFSSRSEPGAQPALEVM